MEQTGYLFVDGDGYERVSFSPPHRDIFNFWTTAGGSLFTSIRVPNGTAAKFKGGPMSFKDEPIQVKIIIEKV